jgi:hypothetical protein
MSQKRKYIFLVFMTLSITSFSQQLLTLDIYRPFGFKRIRYHIGDQIVLKLKGEVNKRSGKIESLGDFSLFVSGREIIFDSVRYVYVDRTNLLTGLFSRFFMYAGLGYMAVDTFNNLKLGDLKPVKSRVLMVGLPLTALGWSLYRNRIKRYRLGKNKVLNVIDITM